MPESTPPEPGRDAIPPEQAAWYRDEVAHAAAAYRAGLDAGLSAGYQMGQSMRYARPTPGRRRRRIQAVGSHWTDRWVAVWYRFTYCTRHGHRYSAFGGDVDDYCLNCGTSRGDVPAHPSSSPGSD